MSIKSKYIGDSQFYKKTLSVAVPIMIQNGITNFVGLLDNIMVGRVGTEQMSGIAIVNQLLIVFNLAIFGAISGAGIFTAQYYGAGDDEGFGTPSALKCIYASELRLWEYWRCRFSVKILSGFIFMAKVTACRLRTRLYTAKNTSG